MISWGWIVAGLVVLWLMRGGKISLSGQQVVPQFPGAAGIVQTLGLMKSMVNGAIDHPLIRQYAVRATEHVPRGHQKEAALAIGEWVRSHVRYVPDPLNKENLTHPGIKDDPRTMIEAIHAGKKVFGDCDDMSMLVAAMGKSIGMQPFLHGVGRGEKYHHVYTELGGVAVDPTVNFGTKPFDAKRRLSLKV